MQLYVPKGCWLTGSLNLNSHLTLYLEKCAVIIGSVVIGNGALACSQFRSLSRVVTAVVVVFEKCAVVVVKDILLVLALGQSQWECYRHSYLD